MSQSSPGVARVPTEQSRPIPLLLDVARAINAEVDLESVLLLAGSMLRALFAIDCFAVILVRDTNSWQVGHSNGLSESYLTSLEHSINDGASGRALQPRQSLYLHDMASSPEFGPLGEACRNQGIRSVLIWPMYAGSNCLGYLHLYHRSVREYTGEEQAVIDVLSNHVALAVQHQRIRAAAEQHQQEMEQHFIRRSAEVDAIDGIVLRISSSLDLESTLQSIMDSAAALSEAQTGALYFVTENDEFDAVAAYGVSLDDLRQVPLDPRQGMLAHMIATGEPVLVSNFAQEVTPMPGALHLVAQQGLHATLGVPLMQDSTCIGALYVASTKSRPFSTEAVHVLQRFGSFALVAVQNARRFSSVEAERNRLELEQERTRTSLLRRLLDLSIHLNSSLAIQVLSERVVDAAMDLVGASGGTLGLLDGEKLVFRRFHLPTGWIDYLVEVHEGEGVPGYVWSTRSPYVCNDCAADDRVIHRYQEELGFHRMLSVPIFNGAGNVIGALNVYDSVPPRDFNASDVEVLRMLAHQAAIAIENAKLNGMRDDFLSIVSHELKTPVTSIKGFAQVLKRRLPPESLEQGSRYLDIINAQSDRLTALINDLLDLSRIQTGRFTFAMNTVRYSELIRDVLDELRLINPANPIRVSVPDGVTVQGNENRLRQVLINLIDNAVKHGPPGGPVYLTVEDGETVATYVCDEGTALPPAESERVFAPYYQVRPSSDRYSKGLGLGLYITRQIIEEHGGHIWLEATDHTSFAFTLARDAASQGAVTQPSALVHEHVG